MSNPGKAVLKPQERASTRMNPVSYGYLVNGIDDVLEAARRTSARAINALMTATYWEIGRRIIAHEQRGKSRAGYGEALIERLSQDLTARFGRGFSVRNVSQMRALYLAWPILQTVSAESDGMAIQLIAADLQKTRRMLEHRSQGRQGTTTRRKKKVE
ncbi:MAG: hypothetical protein KC643_27410 [Nitrospira sp.]|nr:hypothetical protein [Nitrospira sp.]